jgi:membrane protease YdiL (CAAX protease family)
VETEAAAAGSWIGGATAATIVVAGLAVLAILTIKGRLRWLWLNRHELLRVVWRFILHAVLLALLVYAASYGARWLVGLLGIEVGPEGPGDDNLVPQILGYLIGGLAVFAAGALAARWLDRRPVASLGLGLQSRWRRQLVIGLALGAVFNTVVVAILAATGSIRLQSAGIAAGDLARSGLLAALLMVGVAFLEELVFRGYVLQVLAEGIGDFVGYLRRASSPETRRSSVLAGQVAASILLSAPFGFAHYNNPNGTVVGAVATGAAGLVLCLAYFRTRSLWLPIGLHMAWNFVMGWLWSVRVSGQGLPDTPFTTESSGPEWWSGGAFGPESSILTFLALAGMAVLMVRSRQFDATPDTVASYPPPEARLAPHVAEPVVATVTDDPDGMSDPSAAEKPDGEDDRPT